jgi:hypothetical protein
MGSRGAFHVGFGAPAGDAGGPGPPMERPRGPNGPPLARPRGPSGHQLKKLGETLPIAHLLAWPLPVLSWSAGVFSRLPARPDSTPHRAPFCLHGREDSSDQACYTCEAHAVNARRSHASCNGLGLLSECISTVDLCFWTPGTD